MVTVHRIEGDGSLSQSPVEMQKTTEKAHCIQTDPSNRFALVPHTGPNRVYQFLFDSASGGLKPNDPPYWGAETGEEPRHFCFHPSLDVIYISNEKGSSVTACRFDPSGGTISSFQSLSTLPDGWEGESKCAQIHITPAGLPGGPFLYVSNRGHHSIACYAVDNEEGRMTSLGQRPTESTPRAFNVDSTGRFLVAAGRDTGNLALYAIDPATGLLDPLSVTHVGPRPMWVLFV
jgi:6-phosphogluconolactonase